MKSKEALEHLENAYYSERYPMSEFVSMTDLYTIKQDLERLENLEKAIEIILKYKIKPSAFIFTIKNYKEVYGKDLTFEKAYDLLDFDGTQEEYELLKEVLEDDK